MRITKRAACFAISAALAIGMVPATALAATQAEARPSQTEFKAQYYYLASSSIDVLSLNGGTGVDIKWFAASGAEGYNVMRAVNASGPYTKVATVSANTLTYTDKGLKKGTKYYYRIDTFGTNEQGQREEKEGYYKYITTVPSTTTITKLSRAGKNQTYMQWKSVPGATAYEILRSTKASSGFKVIDTWHITSYYDSKATNYKSYYYKVRPVVENYVSGKTVTTKASASKAKYTMGMGVLKSTSKVGNKAIKFKWSKVPDATGYYIMRSTKSSTSGYKKVKTVKASVLSYTTPTLTTSSKTYYYEVIPYKKSGGKITKSKAFNYAYASYSLLRY